MELFPLSWVLSFSIKLGFSIKIEIDDFGSELGSGVEFGALHDRLAVPVWRVRLVG